MAKPTSKRKAEIFEALIERDGPRNCHWCARLLRRMPSGFMGTLPGDAMTQDHLKPRAYGGTNALANLVLACPPCNEERGAHQHPLWGKTFVIAPASPDSPHRP